MDNAEIKQLWVDAFFTAGITSAPNVLSVGNIVASAMADAEERIVNGYQTALRESTGVLARRASSLRAFAYSSGIRLARKQPAVVAAELFRQSGKGTLEIPRFTTFNVDGRQFYNRSEVFFPVGQTHVGENGSLLLYAGSVYSVRFNIKNSSVYERIELPFSNFEISDRDLVVKVNGKIWEVATKPLFEYGRGDEVYLEGTTPSGTAYIVFGVGNYGKRPKESDVIDVTYTLVDGPKSNRTVANLDVTVSTFAQVSGRTLTAVQYGEDEPDPENYRLDAPLTAREGERPSTQEALDSKLSNAINVADARCFDQSTLAAEFGEKYDHPAYMNTLVIAVLPKHGTALSEAQRVSYLAYVESLIMMQEVELWWATPVEFDLDVELNVWPDQDAEAAKAAVSANLLALYGRSRGSLGRNLTQTDYARCLTDAVDTAEFTAGELRTLRRNEYPVLRNLTVTAYWTKRVMRR